ncbi:MAG: signal peptide peptidase SppA [Lentisphaerae bacterium]|nr:signal peptide peptidase SppA [Lentisphaerota bacterium]
MASERRSRHGCLWALLIVALLAGLSVIFVIAGIAALSGSVHMPRAASFSRGEDEYPKLTEVWASGDGNTKAVMVPLKGIIFLDEEDGLFSSGPGSAVSALKAIRRATHDADVKAVILEVDSGGGGITASDILYRELIAFKEAQPGRKVVAVCGDVAASGAYYVSLAADRIVAHPTTLTGSIGVLMQSFNLKELGEKIGVRDVTIKSGANKDILNPFGELSPEQRAMLQGIVDNLHERFIQLVATHRGMPPDEVRKLADGRVMVADDAVAAGLIDEIGYWNDGVAAAAEMLGVPSLKVYRYEKEFSFSDMFKSWTAMAPQSLIRRLPATRFMYLWQP